MTSIIHMAAMLFPAGSRRKRTAVRLQGAPGGKADQLPSGQIEHDLGFDFG